GLAGALVLACILRRRYGWAALVAISAAVATAVTELVLKPLIGGTSWGNPFPSGHVTSVVALATALALLLARTPARVSWPLRLVLALMAFLMAGAVALGVIGAQMHHFSDAVGGAVVGIGTVLLTALALAVLLSAGHWQPGGKVQAQGPEGGPGRFVRRRKPMRLGLAALVSVSLAPATVSGVDTPQPVFWPGSRRRLTRTPPRKHEQVNDQRGGKHGAAGDGGSPDGGGEVVEAQGDHRGGDGGRYRERDHRRGEANCPPHARCPREQHRYGSGQGERASGVAAGKAEEPKERAAGEGLEQPFGDHGRGRGGEGQQRGSPGPAPQPPRQDQHPGPPPHR